MKAMEAILTRRSIRKYTKQAVSESLVKEILTAAMSAPSANNKQPWQFVVMNQREVLDKVPEFHPHASMIKEAPLAILVCGDLTRQEHKGYLVLDCTAATENLLLAVHAKGLGGVWLGIYPREERMNGIKKLLALPDDIMPIALLVIGYPAEQKPKENRYNDKVIHYNTFSKRH